MRPRGHDGTKMWVQFREPAADPHWKRNYMRLMMVAFIGLALWGAWLNSWQVMLGSLLGSVWSLVMSHSQ